uniref:Uncharacterized protein n=1 Tax=Acrobeloides nanus TaxID=290746 RepID=A0A914DR54_9BILA
MVKKKRAPSAEDRIRLLEDSLEETQKFRDYGSVAQNSAEEKKRLRRKTFGLFSYTNTLDYILIIVGTTASIIHGAGFPLLSIVLGGMTTIFLRAQNSPFVWGPSFNISAAGVPPISREEFDAEVVRYSLYYLLLGVAMLITSYIQIACWESVAERLTHNLRKNYLKAILRQEIAWFDKMQTGNLTARLTDDLERVREGLGDKLSLFIQMLASFVAGFIVGFIYNWQMSLIMLLFTPLLMLASFLMAKTASERTHVEQTKYAVAGGIAEETFSSIRTVLSLNGQHQELRRYEAALEDGRQTGLLKYIYMGLGFAFTALTTYISYAVAFWFGSRLIIWDVDFDRGSIFTVFFAVMSGSTALGGALPNLASISMARGSARMVISVLNSEPKIDPYSDEGIIVSKPKGAISVRNVHFSYPIRKDLQILNGVSFNIEPGQKLALVGSSGCGKSTIISLLLRFYDPDSGSIFLDGQDLKSFNVRSLRDAIGIVSQEPVLFDGTLEENVLLGNEKASRDDVIEVLKQANAYEFIKKLPEGLKTRVGERGVQLSGGQKQRIAIARALIKNPKILLLDEATSALDTESEALVQRALEKAQEGRTTITVAHRLSTIRDVDKILVFRQGEVIESGTHEELMNAHGVFYDMVQQQQIHQLQEGAQLDKIAEENEQNDETSIRVDSTVTGSPRKITSAALSPRRKLTSVSSVRSEGSRMLLEMQQDIEDSKIKPTPLWKIMKMNRDKWHFFALAIFGCIINGLVVPFFALVYSQIFNVFSEPIEQLNTDALFWSFMFVAIGIANAIGQIISAVCCGQCGEALTKKLRFEAFRNLLRQDIAFYDDQRHNTGKLCTRFATDVPNVRYVFTRLPVVISSVVTLIGAIVIGFAYGWQLALVLLAIIPLIIGSGYFEMKMHFGRAFDATALLEDAGKVATEAVENIRTVAGLNKQLIFHEKYSQHVNDPYK